MTVSQVYHRGSTLNSVIVVILMNCVFFVTFRLLCFLQSVFFGDLIFLGVYSSIIRKQFIYKMNGKIRYCTVYK